MRLLTPPLTRPAALAVSTRVSVRARPSSRAPGPRATLASPGLRSSPTGTDSAADWTAVSRHSSRVDWAQPSSAPIDSPSNPTPKRPPFLLIRPSRARPGTDPAGRFYHFDPGRSTRSEEHTSELQSRGHLVCRLLLEKKKNIKITTNK